MQQNQSIAHIDVGVERTLRRMSVRDCKVLLAVSGGADSMVMLTIFSRLAERHGLQLAVITFDHQLRPESQAEAELVLQYAKSLGVQARCVALQLGARDSAGLENLARQARYRELEVLRLANGYRFVATAHTASDQAETLLMRLIRGSALGGAAGVQELRSDAVLRPLLHLTRGDIEQYATALSVPFVRDPMNADQAFLRVRMRENVLPTLSVAAGFDGAPALARFAALAAEDDRLLQRQATDALTALSHNGGLQKAALLALEKPLARRVLARFLATAGLELDAELIEECLRAAREGTRATLPGDQLLECAGPIVQLKAAPPRAAAGG